MLAFASLAWATILALVVLGPGCAHVQEDCPAGDDISSFLQLSSRSSTGRGREENSLPQAPHSWKNSHELGFSKDRRELPAGRDHLAELTSDLLEEVADVYFLRHGQVSCGPSWPWSMDDKPQCDALLTEKGVKQAVLAQEILEHKLGLGKVLARSVQLATSLNTRSLDTLVIASAPLWGKWLTAGEDFQVHEVPAAMEENRLPGVGIDDPVRWEHSVFAGNSNSSVLGNATGALAAFYQTAEEFKVSPNVTTKPVQVQSFYKRGPVDKQERCGTNVEQFANLAAYLEASAQAGKKHIVISTHGFMIVCMAVQYFSKATVPTESGKLFHFNQSITKSHQELDIPNAAVLHTRLRRGRDKPIVLEPQFLYEVSLMTFSADNSTN